MSYCIEKVRLMRAVGDASCKELLPPPFQLWFGRHDTGHQPIILIRSASGKAVYAWRGSEWFSGQYEFNDHGHDQGIQPGFEWAEPILNQYFDDLAKRLLVINERRAARELERQELERKDRQSAIDAARAQVEGASQ